ncbi:protein EOLA1 isoform X1 [Hypanus sabinus]|uniref:protein EOLA1 isoform X1 n=1 Tax=Hypanus sabinus TaxID=79690 RepID=UPI0028C4FC9A|nr:protein EOLA1 isoform X1 [Hypanus sabinus]
MRVSCLSFRQPYAGLILNNVKTVETRWRPLLAELQGCTLAIHVAYKDWEGSEWEGILTHTVGMSQHQIQNLLQDGEKFGRGAIVVLKIQDSKYIYDPRMYTEHNSEICPPTGSHETKKHHGICSRKHQTPNALKRNKLCKRQNLHVQNGNLGSQDPAADSEVS